MRLRWTVVFLTVTATAVGMELWAANDGNPHTDPWTALVVRHVPAPITFTLIGVLIIWLPAHFWQYYARRRQMTHRADEGTPVTDSGPIETKVKASTVFAYLGTVALLAVLNVVQSDASLISGLPDWLETLMLPLIPAAATFVAGWQAKHTPRAVGSS